MKHTRLVTGTLLVVSMLTVMSGSLVAPALPAMAEYLAHFRHGALMASYLIVTPALGVVLSAPVTGWAADRYGSWRVLVVSVLVLMVSGASGAWSAGYASLLTGRFVLGVAIASISTSTTSLLGSLPAEAQRQELLGKQSAFINAAAVIYTLAGGLLAAVHWRAPFLLYLWSAALLPFIRFGMQTHVTEEGKAARIPQGALPAFLRSTAMPAAVFVWVTGCIAMAMIYTLFTAQPFRMQELGFEDPKLVSFTIMAASALAAIAGWNFQRLSRLVGPLAAFALAFLMFGAGFLVVSAAQALWHVLVGNMLLGIGIGLAIPNGAAWLSRIAPGLVRGRMLGIFNTFVFLGQFLSPLLIRTTEFFASHVFPTYPTLGLICFLLSGLSVIAAKFRLVTEG